MDSDLDKKNEMPFLIEHSFRADVNPQNTSIFTLDKKKKYKYSTS